MDLDSALLRAFVATADELHFGRAATALRITQQALSKRVARLEALLGVRLLHRSRQSVELTPAGKRFLPEARRAVDATDAAWQSVSPGHESLTVDVLDEHLSMLPVIRELEAGDDELRLSVVMRADASPVLTMLRGGKADLALGRIGPIGVPRPTDIRAASVLAERICLLVPRGHELDRPEGVSMAELAAHRLWYPTTGAPEEWTALLAELVADFGLNLDEAGSTLGYAYWVGLVAQGSAPPSFIGSAMQVPADVAASVVPLILPTPIFWWWAMWRRRLPTPLVGRLLGSVEMVLRDGDGQPDPVTDPEVWMPGMDRAAGRHSASQPHGSHRTR